MLSDQAAVRSDAARAVQSVGQVAGDEAASDAALWTEVMTARDLAVFARAWLAIVGRSAPAIVQSAFLHGSAADAPLKPIARWAKTPGAVDADRFSHGIAPLLAAITETRQPAIEAVDDGPDTKFAGIPVVIDDTLHAAVLVEAALGDTSAARRLMRHLQWGSAWIETFLRRTSEAHEQSLGYRATTMIDTLNAAVSQDSHAAACRMFTARLAEIFHCERVCFGYRRYQASHITALHQSASFERKQALARTIEAAMDEAIDQKMALLTPAPDDAAYIAHAQENLARQNGAVAVLTVPVVHGGDPVGAVTLERFTGATFTQDEVDLCDALTAAIGPVLVDKRQHDWSVGRIVYERALNVARKIVGPRHLGHKLSAAALFGAALFLAFATDTYRIHARGQIQGEVRRILNAPFDGYIRAQHARAGQIVRQDEVLAELQDNDLTLDRLRHVAQRRQYQLEFDRALSKRDLAQTNIARAQIEQKVAEIELADQMLARTQVRAPFDSVIVSGDLSQSIGRPVARGDVLFEIAPLDRYRITLIVPETDIQSVRSGQTGELLLAALPERVFEFEIRTLTTVARAADGVNGFEALADLREPDPRLRPAMEGVAKITIGRRHLVWIWTHELYYWLRVKIWSLIP